MVVCRFWQQGNCKFGCKCFVPSHAPPGDVVVSVLLHVLPDSAFSPATIVSAPPNGSMMFDCLRELASGAHNNGIVNNGIPEPSMDIWKLLDNTMNAQYQPQMLCDRPHL